MKRGVFFDLDGTLVDTLADICGVLNVVRADFGLDALPHPQITACIGKGAEHLIRETFPELSPALRVKAIDKYREFYLRILSQGGKLYPKVRETLDSLRQQSYLLGIATNKPHELAVKTLEHYLPQFRFDVVLGPEKVTEKKPSPHHLWEALKTVEVDPSQAWFVGDDPVDLACADAAGVRFLGAGWGFGGVAPGPDRLVGQFADILAKIQP